LATLGLLKKEIKKNKSSKSCRSENDGTRCIKKKNIPAGEFMRLEAKDVDLGPDNDDSSDPLLPLEKLYRMETVIVLCKTTVARVAAQILFQLKLI
jgi:hypothetical protein